MCEDNLVRQKASNTSAISTEWTPVPTGNHFHNQNKTNKNNKHLITSCDQTIETTNCFTSLSNLEVVDMALHEPLERIKSTPVRTTSGINQHHHNIGFKIPTLINGQLNYKECNSPSAAKKKSMSVSRLYPNSKENKVRVLGDSYLKELAAKIDHILTSNYEVSSWIKPGANTNEPVSSLENDFIGLGKSDVIILNGGGGGGGVKRGKGHTQNCGGKEKVYI